MESIFKVIDDSLINMQKSSFAMMTNAVIPLEMIDTSIIPSTEYKGWMSIPSIVNDDDLNRFERVIEYKLPRSYREYLKHKHFVNLYLPNNAIDLGTHLASHNLSELDNKIFKTFDPDQLIGRGYIYFADFHDYGLLCFDANIERVGNEYKVVYIDHEDLDLIHDYADNFKELIESDEEHGNRFIDKLNEFYK